MASIHPLPAVRRALRIGERLQEAGQISADQIRIALHEQRRGGGRLGDALLRLGFLNDETLAAALADHTGTDSVDLKQITPDLDALRALPRHVAERCRAVPFALDAATLCLAMADPHDIAAIDEVRRYFPRQIDIVPFVASAADILELIQRHARQDGDFDGILHEMEGLPAPEGDAAAGEAWRHPVIRLVDTVVSDAVRAGASDIHLEPETGFIRLRLRIDGLLRQDRALHRAHWPELSHRLKIMAGMNIADTRSMQDGRFAMQVGGAEIDFRMAVMPTVQGENIVIRILDHRRALLPLDALGYGAEALQNLDAILERPEGIVLVTGPTGSGKTTTLYAMLKKLSRVEVNIMTLEEPVEYRFELIRQTAIQDQQGMDFAEGVRGILRQAPDIIFVGEVRDPDTARMAMRAAMTGHQVFTTLHCNDVFGALPRLADLGLSARMMAENIGGIVGQRLVRKLCPHCAVTRPATIGERDLIEAVLAEGASAGAFGFAEAPQAPLTPLPELAEPRGCNACGQTGYRGRLAVNEILRITPELDTLIAADAPRGALRQQALAQGFRPMAQDGVTKVLARATSLAELRRAVDLTRYR